MISKYPSFISSSVLLPSTSRPRHLTGNAFLSDPRSVKFAQRQPLRSRTSSLRASLNRHVPTHSQVNLSDLEPTAQFNSNVHLLSDFSQNCRYLFYTLTTTLLVATPCISFAQTAAVPSGPSAAVPAPDASQLPPSESGTALSSQILGWIAFILLIYLTVGAVYLTIDNFIIRRNNEDNRKWVNDLVEGREIPENVWWAPELEKIYPRGRSAKGSSAVEGGLNRGMRRTEKKMKDKQDRQDAKRKKKTEARAAKKEAAEQDSKEKK